MERIMLSRLGKFVEEIKLLSDQAKTFTVTIDDNNIENAKLTHAKLQSVLSRFTTELYNYFKICKDPDEDEISEYSTHQMRGEELVTELDMKLKSKHEATATAAREERYSSFSKLPDLNLPRFSGNLLEWHPFWDQFTSNINRRKMEDVDKLLYLKSYLEGDAARLVDGLETTNDNFKIAVEILKSRYGKNEEIIYAHHCALNMVKEAETTNECRTSLDEIERHLRVLESLKQEVNSKNNLYLITEKFPTDIIYEMKMRLGPEENYTVKDALKQLSIIISTREEASRRKKYIPPENPSKYTTETLLVNENRHQNKNFFTRNESRHFKRENNQFNTRPNSTHPYKRRHEPQRSNDFKPYNRRPLVQRQQHTSNYDSGNHSKNVNPHKRKLEGNNDQIVEEKRRKLLNQRPCLFCNENHQIKDCVKVTDIAERKKKLIGRCFKCLKFGHQQIRCTIRRRCPHCRESGRHHPTLCPKRAEPKTKREQTNNMHVHSEGSTILQTALVEVKGEYGKIKRCRVLLDCGSQRSYITQRVVKDLDLRTEEHNYLSIFTFGSETPKEITSPLVKIKILIDHGETKDFYANVVPSISQGISWPRKEIDALKDKEKRLLADNGSLADRVDILLGNDYYYSIMLTNKMHIKDDLYLVESKFGWVLSGKVTNKPVDKLSVVTYFQSSCESHLNKPDLPLSDVHLKTLWDLESIGITDSPKANRDEEAIKNFNDTTILIDNRYYVSWPWKSTPDDLPSNFGLALGRLTNLLKRLDSKTVKAYDDTLKEQLEKGIIEVVPKQKENFPIHYIPHHGVSTPGKTLRIVYDASAKVKDNKSLNEHLYCGPMLLEDLTGLLIKFRCNVIGLTADVEKAFLQVGLNEQDRDVTRFLWIKDTNGPALENNLVHLRFARVPFGVISSPFLLNATIKHHLSRSTDKKVKQLANEIYVDNLVTGTENSEEALKLYQDSKEVFQQISMNLREWSSNSRVVMQSITDTCKDQIVKVLGLNWHLEDDTLHIRTKLTNSNDSKRGMLKTIASIYDPCGYTVPIVLSAKLLLQDIWKLKLKWDTTLPENFKENWHTIQEHLKEIETIKVNRCYMENPEDKDFQMHCFTDASMRAYAAAVYIVNKDRISFVIGKSRLVPIKDQDFLKIPRLELLGVLIGTRLMKYALKFLNLNITRKILWTDSQIVIDWTNSDKLLTPFVSRRIEEIKSNKDLTIRHIPSELNPADIATRPIILNEDTSKWLSGPSFILQHHDNWPPCTTRVESFFVGEGLKDITEKDQSTAQKIDTENNKDIDLEIIETESHDNTLKEIKELQKQYFTQEVNGKETNLSRNLGLFKDIDGILRCKGRLKYAEWSFDKRYPIIIPNKSEFTNKIIKDTHERNYHVGANHTLSIIRQTYWIPQGKSQVQRVLRKCPRCTKHGGGPFKLPPTPPLPHERVNYSKPFTFTGLDYLGPVLVKTENGTNKRWICLFTCLAIRAIHLEIVDDLTAEEGLNALRRMISTRGVPNVITSDNALYFKLMSEIVSNSYCVKNKIKWKFIPELAPWFGGFYERLVGLVKHCMKRTLQKHILNDSQLRTMIKEIEAVLNTRPLTCVDSEPEHVLTPADFILTGNCIVLDNTSENDPIKGPITKTSLIQSWRKARIILEEFKEMFKNRYLPSLRERYNHSKAQPRITSNLIPTEGQIVQIKDNINREGWKVGKIASLEPSNDGLTRVAKVKVGDKLFTRSVAHLYPIEVEDNEPVKTTKFTSEIVEPKSIQIVHDTEISKGNVIPPNINSTPTNELNDEIEISKACDSSEFGEIDAVTLVPETDDVKGTTIDTDINDTIEEPISPNLESKQSDEENASSIPNNNRPKRAAAVRALEKIREWTRNLMTIIL